MRWEAVKRTCQWHVRRPTVRARKREDVDFARSAKYGIPQGTPFFWNLPGEMRVILILTVASFRNQHFPRRAHHRAKTIPFPEKPR